MPRDYYDASPPDGPDWAVLEEKYCGPDGCGRASTTTCPYRLTSAECPYILDRLREEGEEALARKENAEIEAGERREDE